jgi:hypothetical protein
MLLCDCVRMRDFSYPLTKSFHRKLRHCNFSHINPCSFSVPFAVGKSNVLVHLRHWRARMCRILLSANANGYSQRHTRRCHFRFGILSPANGDSIWHKCSNHDSVSDSFFYTLIYLLKNFFTLSPSSSSSRGMIGTVLTGLSIMWCAISASKLFTTALSMDHQQFLVAYPCTLFYGVFALMTIF